MKKVVIFSCICVLTVFGFMTIILSADGQKETAGKPPSPSGSIPRMDFQDMAEPDGRIIEKVALPDYHPREVPRTATSEGDVPRPDSLEETMSSVESSLNDRIRILNQNLGNREVRISLQQELTGTNMAAYKAAVLWTVKNSQAGDSE